MRKIANIFRLTLVFALTFVGLSNAQNTFSDVLIISPESVQVPPNGTVKFRAQLFGVSNFSPIISDRIDWRVDPEGLGKITEGGFFVAGERPGRGLVIAIAKIFDREFRAEARVQVGNPDAIIPDYLRLIVVPEEAALGFGDSLRFQARLRFMDSTRVVPNLLVNWAVEPRGIGKINQRGLFVGGSNEAHGRVIAFVEHDGARIFGKAHVVIGLRPDAAIAGNVVDEDDQSAISGALVVAQRIGHIKWHRRTLSDENGDYVLGSLIPGRYVVWAKAKGYITEFYQEARHYQDATAVGVAENDTATGIDFTLNHGGAIAGSVYSEVDSTPLPRTHVFAFRMLSTNANLRHHAVTDENGNYTLGNLPGGSYVLIAEKEGYQREFYDDASTIGEATPVKVNEPDTTKPVDFALGIQSAVSGRVISDTDSSGIKGAVVFARDLNSAHDRRVAHRNKTRTNENGDYIMGLPPGFYLIGVMAEGFNDEYYDDVFDPALATPVQVFEDQHTSGIDFGVAPLSSMSGVVTDQNTGDPIDHALVYAFPEVGGGEPVKGRTDENGGYTLKNLRPGIYFVKANAKGYHSEFYQEAENLANATPVPVGINEQIENIDFTLIPAGAIEGTVVSEVDDSPIARALVVAKMVNSPFHRKALSDDDGNYRIDNLRAGTYIVYAMAKGFFREFYDNADNREDATPLELAASEVRSGIDFSVSPAPDNAGSITGFVQDDHDNLPIPGAIIVAVAAGGGFGHFGVTGPAGRYGVKGLPSGDYFVMAWADGYIGEFYDDVHNWRRATLVKVVSPNETPDIDFGLAKRRIGPYRVRGRIVSRQNQPIANALVYVRSNRGLESFAVSDETGNYTLEELPAGNMKIVAVAPGLTQNNDNDLTTDDSVSVELNSGMDNYEANITMDERSTTGVEEIDGTIPVSFGLEQNYPNPFNPETEIQFHLPTGGDVTLTVFNILGQEIATLVSESLPAGNHAVNWNGLNRSQNQVPSGIYFYSIKVKNGSSVIFEQVYKMTLMR
jgi:protocatechuate 3,4-dioxygenase beta subunit